MKQITLNIGGQDRIFYFGLGFLGNLLQEEGVSIQDFDELKNTNPFRYFNLLMYHSLAWGFIREEKEVAFTKLDVINWIDETDGIVEKFNTAFTQSLIKDVPEQKKKAEKATTK